ncbi:glycosyltransferase family 4 protein [Mucilaginibacter sp. SP1R1]|uniref:glycosyltransferase family 4 protein n=1 Tax=Mucilaginibacter sp. SP1R1 TaxID=2723091 RepID=UPI00161314BF|nr:glycosyltransferase family 4 protein [Mucilaginibacter sp. SP1R1]MBB6151149.1 glycosyltransferase involved in cell wall biosynthesis [Mucilaginibacter sp. SP1R1]
MNPIAQKVLIACDSSKSLMDFRGKLVEAIAHQHKVHVYTPGALPAHFREKLNLMRVEIHEIELEGGSVSVFSDLRYIIQLYKLMKKIRPDVFFPYTVKPVIYGTLVAKICGIKSITPMLTGLGYNFTSTSQKKLVSNITRGLLKFSLAQNKSLKIIFHNKDDYQTLLQHKIITTRHQAFIVNGSGVDLDHYIYTRPDVENISFLMVARLINAKGIQEYYEAAKNIRSRFPDIQFKLIGAYGSNVDTISDELYAKIACGDVVDYLGEVDDVRPYIRDASVIVLPSYREGMPRSLLEGMAMGRAIITSDSVGCRETIDADTAINGFLVPVKNIPELISKMEFYLHNRTAIHTYGVNGLAFARRKFDVHLVNAEMLKIMQLN